MSLKLTTSLSQRLVLTPQLRQRIEMLQMTTLELTDLIQQQLLENPVLEEVATQEEARELAEKILDHLAGADAASSLDHMPDQASEAGPGTPSSNGAGDSEALATAFSDGEMEAGVDSVEAAGASDQREESASDEI